MNKKKVIIDTDIGGDVDDAYAIALALNSPELEIKAIITNDQLSKKRAQVANILLSAAKADIPIFQGLDNGQGIVVEDELVKESKFEPKKVEDNLEFFRNLFSSEIYYVSIGCLSNVNYFIDLFPDKLDNIHFFIMGGSIERDYKGNNTQIAEWNIRSNVAASQRAFKSNAEITLFPLDSTWNLALSEAELNKIANSKIELNIILNKLWKSYHSFLINKFKSNKLPVLFDPLVVASLIDPNFVELKKIKLVVDSEGKTLIDLSGKDVNVAVESKRDKLIMFFMRRICNGKTE